MQYALLLTSLSLVLAGCGKTSSDKAEGQPAAEVTAPATDEVVEKAATYSEEAAAALLAKMAACESYYDCESLDTLITFGDKVSAALIAIAVDTSKSKVQRTVAVKGLEKIKDPATGLRLFEAGKVEEDSMLNSDLFKAAGASGDAETFKAMIADYASDSSKPYRTQLGFGVDAFDKSMIFDYASSNYPDAEDAQIRFANLVRDSAPDAAVIEPLLAKTKNTMARHRLASAMVAHGDTSKLDILITGLESKDQYDRSDAANFLAKVIDKLPAERKTEVAAIVTKAKAGDQGGLTSMGYDKILKELAK